MSDIKRDDKNATDVNAPADPQRRRFVQLMGMGGLVLAAGPNGVRRLDDTEQLMSSWAEPWSPVAYVTLNDDGMVTIICHRSEMGQGIRTTMPMIIADEMEADWSKCRVEQADGNEKKYGSQNTDGSTSIRDFLTKYREAGATMRALVRHPATTAWISRLPRPARLARPELPLATLVAGAGIEPATYGL